MQLNKIFCTAAALVVLGTMASGCGSETASEGKNDGVIELKYWYSWQDKIAENNKELTQKFNDTVGKEKGIHVTAEYQGSYDDLHSKLQSAFAAHEEPAVSVMEISSIKTFAKGGMINPLDEYFSKEDCDDFYPGLLKNSYVDNKLYGIPYLRSTPVLYYNKTLFKKAGLDPEKGPATWAELKETSKKLQAIGVSGFGFISDPWPLEALISQNGGSTLSEDETKAAFNSAAGVGMTEYLRSGIADSNFKYYNGNNGADNSESAFMNQQLAMRITSTADLTKNLKMAEENGYEIGTCFIPMQTRRGVPTGGCNLVMTSALDDKKKAAAAEFIRFMTSPEQAVYSHLKTGYLPTRKSIADNEKIKAMYVKVPQYKTALDQLQYAFGRPMNQGYKEVCKVYSETMDKILTSTIDIKTALDEAAAKSDKLLEK